MPFNVCVSRMNAPERGSIGNGMEEPQGRNAGPALPFQAPFSSVGGSRGFSLLEMMAVIDLILVLCSFSLPIYHSLVVRARETVLREDLFTLRCQIDQFAAEGKGRMRARTPHPAAHGRYPLAPERAAYFRRASAHRPQPARVGAL